MKSLTVLFLCFATVIALVVNVPIKKHVPDAKNFAVRRSNNTPMRSKFGDRLKKTSQTIVGSNENYYVGNITIGTPPQSFRVAFDILSSNLVVVDKSCRSDSCLGLNDPKYGPLDKKQKYNSSASSTAKSDWRGFEIKFGGQHCSGTFAQDRLDFAGFTVPNQTFGAANNFSWVFGYEPYDGVFGLGRPESAVDYVLSPFQMIKNQLDKPVFSIWLDKHVKPSEGSSSGRLTFGAIDDQNCDKKIVYTPLKSIYYWSFQIQGFAIGSYKNTNTAMAVTDTSSSRIKGPVNDVVEVISASKAEIDYNTGRYLLPCDSAKTLADLIFTVNGKQLRIPGSAQVLDIMSDDHRCILSIDFNNDETVSEWSFGESFLRTYCSYYDESNNQIGFAKAHHKEV